jgi:predicted RNase H-like nuclease (RuvC/YqgF family)
LDQIAAPLSAELKALRAQFQFEGHRMQLRITDLETLISSKDAELGKVHVMLREMLGTRAREIEDASRAAEELKARIKSLQMECDTLRHDLDSSLALRAARSLGWILAPIRKILGGNAGGQS